jgi:hypothetical protein
MFVEPESNTEIPAYLNAGESVFNTTIFVPIETAEAVMFSKEDSPCTIKF